MIYIEKGEEPQFLSEFKRKNPGKTYDSKEFQPYRSELTEVLMKEQRGICAYCCGRIKREFAFARKPGADTNLCMKEIDPEILENTRVNVP